ncbi:MAG: MBOAT family O-acyltransferase, partial [Pseudomonadota bacterium]|nr:MBOAT family O-acyltransferase [Pseudomonadota bacterium]
ANKLLLTATIIVPIVALLYFKYLGFILTDVFHIESGSSQTRFDLFSNIVLPAGISFFTFQLIAYTIDKFRGNITDTPTFLSFALYISFFPQLIAGPIIRFNEIKETLFNITSIKFTSADTSSAIGHIVVGLALKVLIADTLFEALKPLIDEQNSVTPIGMLYVIFAYSFQIYFDFFGYSLIAIGLGRLFGFTFPINFFRPYSAPNPREFWRRWHTTLSYWIRDYLYIPLGGNKHYTRNILVIFIVMGIWHGAGWNFVMWGVFHGLLVILYNQTRNLWDNLPVVVQVSTNFLLVSVAWLFFLFDFGELQDFFSKISVNPNINQVHPSMFGWVVLVVAAIVCFGIRLESTTINNSPSMTINVIRNFFLGLLLVGCLALIDRSQTFIYFRF